MEKTNRNSTKMIPEEWIVNKIHIIREQEIITDFDLSALYEVETGYLKRQVRRNIERFPKDFLFELTSQEFNSLRSQFGTLKRGAYPKYLPFAFTEQSVAMLSGVINSEKAIAINIAMTHGFVEIRSITLNNQKLSEQIKFYSIELVNTMFNATAVKNWI